MRIYRLDYTNNDSNRVEWYANKKDAQKALACAKKDHCEWVEEQTRTSPYQMFYSGSLESCEIKLVDFPTRKADVINWLNKYISSDNG
jgi:hypothetical protein